LIQNYIAQFIIQNSNQWVYLIFVYMIVQFSIYLSLFVCKRYLIDKNISVFWACYYISATRRRYNTCYFFPVDVDRLFNNIVESWVKNFQTALLGSSQNCRNIPLTGQPLKFTYSETSKRVKFLHLIFLYFELSNYRLLWFHSCSQYRFSSFLIDQSCIFGTALSPFFSYPLFIFWFGVSLFPLSSYPIDSYRI